MKIGVNLDALGLPMRQALPAVARMGVTGLQLSAAGDLSPERLTDTGRRELRNLLKTYDLNLTALFCPLRHSIDEVQNQQQRIEHVQRIMDLAFEMGPRLVIVQCPMLPAESEVERSRLLREALLALGLYGDRCGTLVALEIGFDATEAVRDYLNTFDVGSLGVNYDPANLLMHGHDPVKSVMPLAGRVLHLHARDARKASVSRSAAEVPLGAGDIEWMGLMGALTAIEYRGWVVIDRESGNAKAADIVDGVSFLKRVIL